tara:strand:+ start:2593 stop:3948 length:1356 start_codon:yes stop_codon:yes gene_type:complete
MSTGSILYHQNHQSINTFNTNLTPGCVNPLRRVSYKQQININTRFRDNYTTTPASDFFFGFPDSIEKAVSMKLTCINIPNLIYTVNQYTGSDNFGLRVKIANWSLPSTTPYWKNSMFEERVRIPSGSYTGLEIVSAINQALVDLNWTNPAEAILLDISANYSKITGKVCFSFSNVVFGSPGLPAPLVEPVQFDLCFNYIEPKFDCSGTIPNSTFCSSLGCENYSIYSQVGSNVFKDQLTLGWILGFRRDYKYNTPKTAIYNNNPNLGINALGVKSTPCLSRKELRNLHSIHRSHPRLTPKNAFGLQYIEQSLDCCDISGFAFFPDPYDISYNYHISLPAGLSTKPKTICGEGIYDPLGNRYFLLSVNDYTNGHTRSVVSPLQQDTLHDGNIIAKIPAGCCAKECEHDERIYFGPTDISRLHIKLLDEFGRVVDLNNGDYSLTLEFEVLYDL